MHAHIVLGIGDAYDDEKKHDTAVFYYNKAVAEFSVLKLDTLVMQTLFSEAQSLKKAGRHTEAQERYEQAIAIAKRSGRVQDQIRYLYKSAGLYETQGYYHLSADRYKETIALADLNGMKSDEANIYNRLAWVYNMLGEHERAITSITESTRIYDSLNDVSGVLGAYNSLSVIYSKQKRYNEALHYAMLTDSLTKVAKLTTMNALANMAIIYKNMGEYEKSASISRKILESDLEDKFTVMCVHSNLIAPLAALGDHKGAKEHFRKCEEMNRRLFQDVFVHIENNKEMAKAEMIAGRMDSALRFAHTYAALCKEHNMLNDEYKDCYTLLADIYKKKGDIDNALRYMKEFVDLQDTLFRKSRNNELAEAEIRLKLVDKNRTLDVLVKENELHKVKGERLAILMGLGGLVVIIGAGSYRRTLRKNAQLKKQKQIIDDQLSQLAIASEMRSKFYANMSHELRTPVTLLSGMLELMKNEGDSRRPEKLDIAYNNSRKLQYMIEEILDLSRLEKSETKLNMRSVVVAPLLRRIVFTFESFIQKKGLELAYADDSITGLHIQVDENKFEKIINNLIFNAIKFNKEKGSIAVKAYRAGNALYIEVRDTGVGISEKDVPYIFERFYQSSSGKNAEGVGIGLSLVKEFTELLGGTVNVTSTPEHGSVFSLSFPLAEPVISQHVTEDPHGDMPQWQLPVDGCSVLIVEDNAEMRYYLKEILGSKVTIAEANNGVEALHWLENNTPDLIISDIMMPQMDGEEFVAMLKRTDTLRKIPVIMLTALAASERQLALLRLGVDDYIVKPFNAEELQARVYNLLNNYAARKEFILQSAEPDDIQAESPEADEFRRKVTEFVLSRLKRSDVSVYDLAYELAMSERHLHRTARSLTGYSPSQLIKEVKLQKAYELLQSGEINKIDDVARRVGFEKASYFSQQFFDRFGKRPSAFL
ncbi:response regulator [Nemorincola caseinilytica]